MNVSINSQVLAAELRLLCKIVPPKPAVQILSHVHLKASERLEFYATDLEVGLSSSCAADVAGEGAAVLPAAKLLALVERFPDEDVSIIAEKTQAVVRCGAFTSKLQVLSADDFPSPPRTNGASLTLDAASFTQLIERTRHAVNAAGAKYILQGALFEIASSAAAMVATDSKRLAIATMGYHAEKAKSVRVVIPAKTLDVLASQVLASEIHFSMSGRHLFFQAGGRLLISRMIDGEFPKYKAVIPRANDKVVSVSRGALIAALHRVNLISNENKAIYLDVLPGAITLSASSAEVGSADEAVAAEYDGPLLKICLNGEYLVDFLEAAAQPRVTIALKEGGSTILLTDSDDYVAVIMLMKR